jgi:hypothetical protein
MLLLQVDTLLNCRYRPSLTGEHRRMFQERKACCCCCCCCCCCWLLLLLQVATLLKSKAGAVTLAIGDGANDVSMIQAAHIGVGISGREGRAAVQVRHCSFSSPMLHGRVPEGAWGLLKVTHAPFLN